MKLPVLMYPVSGYVKYDNEVQTPMSSYSNSGNRITTVFLCNSEGLKVDSTQTDSLGAFTFNNIQNGSYELTCKTTKSWGGANPLDALLVNRYFIKSYSITDPMKILAADVNNDKKINPLDALLFNRRYINAIHKFNIPDWLFQNPTITVNMDSVMQQY